MEYGITLPDYYTRASRGMALFLVIGYKKTIKDDKQCINNTGASWGMVMIIILMLYTHTRAHYGVWILVNKEKLKGYT
ncbi:MULTISPECIES: hypothetical protein [unclassified Legionella]|uniref:hypothetical protein n=1 Tax=unclassified Legionella TaxID=2622702 RepID=UPI00105426A2|nr:MULTISPECIES: hypothetical protein [unclassified Legionella]MDI9819857.1 hypothetical protein [Legionella sp. PL877]